MSPSPWLSVVLCTYQGERYLRDTLASVESQDWTDFEIIAIDDGSTDATPGILAEFGRRLPIRMLKAKRTGNWILNTNRGIAEARGEFVCLLHQDDLWSPGRLETLHSLTREYPDSDVFVNPSHYIDTHGRRIGRWTLPFPKGGGSVDTSLFLERLMVQNLLAIPAPIFRRELAQRVGPLQEDLWFLADWEFWGRLISLTVPYHCPEPLTSFRVHRASQTATRSQNGEDLRRQYHAVIDSIASRIPQADEQRIRSARRAAYLNCEVSIALALVSHRDFSNCGQAFRQSLRLRPSDWPRFWRDSRTVQRLGSRLRARA